MLGAVSALCREIDAEALKGAFSDYFSHLGSEVLARNLGGLEAGRGRARIAVFADWQAALPAPTAPLPVLGYENAPVGGVISNPGNTALRSLAHSRRGTIPVLDFERCIQCGRCDMVCPDYCFVWKIGPADRTQVTLPGGNFTRVHAFASVPILQGIDYQYCKGCQKCVAACPSGALRVAEDTPDHRARSEAARFSGRPAASGPAPLPLLLPTDKDPENES
jgi:pyruvate ferredoxin oxidoreductase gamma subunit